MEIRWTHLLLIFLTIYVILLPSTRRVLLESTEEALLNTMREHCTEPWSTVRYPTCTLLIIEEAFSTLAKIRSFPILLKYCYKFFDINGILGPCSVFSAFSIDDNSGDFYYDDEKCETVMCFFNRFFDIINDLLFAFLSVMADSLPTAVYDFLVEFIEVFVKYSFLVFSFVAFYALNVIYRNWASIAKCFKSKFGRRRVAEVKKRKQRDCRRNNKILALVKKLSQASEKFFDPSGCEGTTQDCEFNADRFYVPQSLPAKEPNLGSILYKSTKLAAQEGIRGANALGHYVKEKAPTLKHAMNDNLQKRKMRKEALKM